MKKETSAEYKQTETTTEEIKKNQITTPNWSSEKKIHNRFVLNAFWGRA